MSNAAERLKLSIWTTMYWELSPEDACEHIASLGWKHIDLSAEHIGEICDGQPPERLERARECLRRLGLTPWQTHAPMDLYIGHADRRTAEEHLEFLRRRLAQCARMAVRNIVIHVIPRELKTLEENLASKTRNIEMLKRVADEAAEAGVKIALENLTGYWGEIGVLREVIEKVGSPALGICFDTSHANVQKLDVPAAIRECGDRLCCLHLSDNNGGSDQHLMPYQGKVDWQGVVTALKAVRYSGALNFEMPGENGCPLAVRDRKMRHVSALMETLISGEKGRKVYAARAEPIRDFCRRGWIDPKFGYP
jgi:sugar phosphate isomerase/epimerase